MTAHTKKSKYCTGKTESLCRPRGAVGSGAAAVESAAVSVRRRAVVRVGALVVWDGLGVDCCEVRLSMCDP